MTDPALNPALDAAAIAATYARDGRVHIPNILTDASAARVRRCLESETQFSIITRGAGGYLRLAPHVQLTPEKEAGLMRDAWAKARDGFHYVYDNHPMSNDGEPYPDPSHYLAKITAFLNSAPFLDFARRVTGSDRIDFAEAQATRYRPGHFLTQHDDRHTEHKRIAAYVLNFTPHWRADWGGALLFSDRPGHISEGYAPAFNALNLFTVPQDHWVEAVAPYAGANRLSITGWLRAR
jgi:SM-20-related protein